ncbi:MAG: hypothetical protein ACKVQK_04425 [Burkholderiales bacterium]
MVQSIALAMSLMAPAFSSHSQVLLAQAGGSLQGLIFDASQISPLGDPAWVASLRGPDPSKPAMNLGNVDAAAPVARSGERDQIPDSTFRRGDSAVRNGQVLNNGRVFLIGAERATLGKAGAILLAPGRAAELGDLRVPFVRVYVAAPGGNALDVDRLVSQRPAIGMFNALFTPAPARRGASAETAIAAVTLPSVAPGIVTVNVPVAERSMALLPIPPASVEDRSFIAFVPTVEERSALLASIPPASVEDRSFIAFAAPVEDKAFDARPLVPAPIEERAPVMVARLPTAPVMMAQASLKLAHEIAEPEALREGGKPVPGALMETGAVAMNKPPSVPVGLMRVALGAPVVVVPATEGSSIPALVHETTTTPVKLAGVRKLLPSVMIDRKGGFFFM